VATIDLDLLQHEAGTKSNVMFVLIMSKSFIQCIPSLQSAIDCLMPCARFVHCQVMLNTLGLGRHNDTRITLAALVSNNLFANAKHALQSTPEDLDVRPAPALKRTIECNNLARLDANSNLATWTSTAKLVRVPLGIKRSWLKDFKVHAIDCNKTMLSIVALKAVLPKDLVLQKKKEAVRSGTQRATERRRQRPTNNAD